MRRSRWLLVRAVTEGDAAQETARFWLLLLAYVLALLTLVVLSIAVAGWLGPWIGALVGAASLGAWIKLVPAGPGCAQGQLCITGAAVLLGAFIACVVRALA